MRRFREDYAKEVRAIETLGQRTITVLSAPVRGRFGLLGSVAISAARGFVSAAANAEILAAKQERAGAATTVLDAAVKGVGSSFRFTTREVEIFDGVLSRAFRGGNREALELRSTLSRLGVNFRTAQKDPEAGLRTLARNLPKAADSDDPEGRAVAFEIFGRNADAMLPKLAAARVAMTAVQGATGGAAKGIAAVGAAAAGILAPIGLVTAAIAASVAIVGALVAVAVKVIASYAKVGEELSRASERTGFGAEQLSVFKLAAEEAGISFDTFGIGLTRFQQRLVEAAEGNKGLSDTFKRLGIDAKAGAENPQAAFQQFTKNFAAAEDNAKKTAIAIELFGESGAKMIPVLNRLGQNFDEVKERAKALGVVLTKDEVDALKASDRAFKDLDASTGGFGLTIAKIAAPAVARFITVIANAIKGLRPFAEFIGKVFVNALFLATGAIKHFIAILATLPVYVGTVISNFGLLIDSFGAYVQAAAAASTAILNPVLAASQIAAAAKIVQDADRAFAEGSAANADKVKNKYAEVLAFLTKQAPNTPQAEDGDSLGLRDPAELERQRKKAEEAARRARELDAQTALAAAERQNAAEVDSLKSAYEAKQKSALEYAEGQRALNLSLANSQRKALEDRLRLLQTEDKLEVEKAAERRAIAEENNKVIAEFRRKDTEIQEEYYRGEIERLKNHKKAIFDLLESQSAQLIAANEDASRRRLVTEESAATRINAIESASLKRRANYLQSELELTGKSASEYQAIRDSLVTLYEEMAGAGERASRRLQVAQRNDAERARAYAIEKRELELDNQEYAIEVGRLDIERMEREGASRRELLRATRNQDIEENSLRRERALRQIEEERAQSIERVRGLSDERAKKKEIDDLYNEQSLLTIEEFERRKKEIQDGYKQQAGAASASGSLLGGLLGQGEADALVGIGEMISSTFGSVASAVGNAARAFVLFGKSGGGMRKFAAETLAAITQMAVVQSVYNVAEGLAKLALAYFGHPTAGASAGAHFAAAAAYAGIAGVSAAAGRSLAGNLFNKPASGERSAAGSGLASGGGSGRDDRPPIIREENRQEVHHYYHVEHRVAPPDGWVTSEIARSYDNNDATLNNVLAAAGAR